MDTQNEINTSKKPTLCLNMIVKNESKIITRLFDSVVSIIDAYCICDTGSTDNTIEIIENYFKEKGIEGKIIQEPFKNFCHNRNVALQGCIGLSDYVLLLDADMILEIGKFDKALLNTADSFMILQGSESFHYQNMRIVKNNGKYSYSGVTHEYINTPESNISYGLSKNILFINDVGDGGSKSDKFERDIRLLTEGLVEDPNNVRYYFYLGNSYHDSGQFEKAIESYKKRIEMGGWKEEVWYSYYRIGLCYKNLNKFEHALNAWLEGYNFYPERLEGIYELIKHYRYASKHKLSLTFYKMAKEILDKNLRREGYLFLHNDIYTFQIYYEYTIIAYYCGITNIDDEIVKVFNNSTNGNEVNGMLSNMKFYKQVLQKEKTLNMDRGFNMEILGSDVDFTSSSSCLIKKPNSTNYLMNVRYVNYYIESNGNYKNCDKYIISINKLIEMDKDLNIITETTMDLVQDGRRYMGIEDVKIYWDQYINQYMHIGTGFHLDNKIGIVAGKYNIEEHKLESNELKQYFANTSCEKNWIFVDYDNSTHVVYDWHPLRICKLNSSNVLEQVTTISTPKMFSRVRGSTCGFVYDDMTTNSKQIWFVNHIVSYETPRHYYHIISVFDSNMNLLKYTAPFKFKGECIEYCLSIVVEDSRVLINYSTWDRTTRIGIYDKKYIDGLLIYTP